jgi:hypothetical protein
MSGNVLGVVTAKLDGIKMAAATGDIPQNVNARDLVLGKFMVERHIERMLSVW